MKVDLKPCPFCGCSTSLYQTYDGLYVVQCDYCNIGTLYQHNKERAIQLWNRRDGGKKK